jgi:uncharacterized protein with HEPN domain
VTDDRTFLIHIRDAADEVLSYASEGKFVFIEDRRTRAAIIRNLEIIGEATKNLTEEF